MDNYTLLDKIGDLSAAELAIKAAHLPTVKEDWIVKEYNPIKQRIKGECNLHQNARCAYCRKELEANGKYEPLEHIVPKSKKPTWMLNPKNLALSCDCCNGSKGRKQTLATGHINDIVMPLTSNAYVIFHPHFDNWQDHLYYEEIFVRPVPNSKGEKTIEICHLNKENCIINRAKELKLKQKKPIGLALQKIRTMDKTNPNFQNQLDTLLNIIEHYNGLALDNDNFN
jgi:uncharacterized protein (TIGR02646 family)